MISYVSLFFFFKQKMAYEMRISDWSSDVCSSDLQHRSEKQAVRLQDLADLTQAAGQVVDPMQAEIAQDQIEGGGSKGKELLVDDGRRHALGPGCGALRHRSEERRVGKEWGSTCRSRWSP